MDSKSDMVVKPEPFEEMFLGGIVKLLLNFLAY